MVGTLSTWSSHHFVQFIYASISHLENYLVQTEMRRTNLQVMKEEQQHQSTIASIVQMKLCFQKGGLDS